MASPANHHCKISPHRCWRPGALIAVPRTPASLSLCRELPNAIKLVDTNTRLVALWTYEHTYGWLMTRKLTISIDDRVYTGLHAVVGRGNIGKFLEDLARPFVVTDGLAAAYIEMSADEAREAEAVEWCEALAADGLDASR
jgi:hypothetical protein